MICNLVILILCRCVFVFFNDTATTEIYTLSLHDALPISGRVRRRLPGRPSQATPPLAGRHPGPSPLPGSRSRRAGRHGIGGDRKSTRLNSSHANISYAVFCLKKKKTTLFTITTISSYEA